MSVSVMQRSKAELDHSKMAKPSKRHLQDPVWRMNNLYFIKPRIGAPCVFKMKPAQRDMMNALLAGKRRIITPKARQMGISTMSILLALDMMLFTPGTEVGVTHLTDEKAGDMIRMLQFAYDRLPDWLKEECPMKVDQTRRKELANGSTIRGGINLRGSTFQFLIVSELGPIEDNSEQKAIEIRDGLLPTVPQDGVIIMESTSKGPTGIYWRMTMQSLKDMKLEKLARRQGKAWHGGAGWHVLFFPWFYEPEYTVAIQPGQERTLLTAETLEYFQNLQVKLRRMGSQIKLTAGQALYYQRQKWTSGSGIFTEYPSTIDEAFMAVSDHAIYNDQLLHLYDKQKISPHHAPDRRFGPIFVSFDLGGKKKHSDHTALTFAQFDGKKVRFLHGFKAKWGDFDKFVEYIIAWCNKHHLRLGAIILPHDATTEYRGTTETVAETMRNAEIAPVIVLPRTSSVWGDITIVQSELLYATFWDAAPEEALEDDDGCRLMLNDLRAYRRKKNKTSGLVEDEPHHGPESDQCDSVRYMIVAKYAGHLHGYVFQDSFGQNRGTEYTRGDDGQLYMTPGQVTFGDTEVLQHSHYDPDDFHPDYDEPDGFGCA